jgi:hypothetical protein
MEKHPTGLDYDFGRMKEAEPRNPGKETESAFHHDKADETPDHLGLNGKPKPSKK